MSSKSVIRSYPLFSESQVLTHDQLNDVVGFLDGENRSTRTRLIGAGIVSGLEISSNLKSYVEVSPGCGLTTRGDLFVVDETIQYTRSRTYSDPGGYFHAAPNRIACIRELVQESQKDAEALDFVRLSQRVVVLYLEQQDSDLRSCVELDCNDRGRRRSFVPRMLLLESGEAVSLMLPTGAQLPNPEQLRLPVVRLQRSVTARDVTAAFQDSLDRDEGMKRLLPALIRCIEQLRPALGVEGPARTVEDLLQSEVMATATRDGWGMQYVWDWMRDLAATCRELVELVTEGVARICQPERPLDWALLLARDRVPEDRFPQHLLLGQLVGDSGQAQELALPGAYRYPFLPSPAAAEQVTLRERAVRLMQRLVRQIEGFRWARPRGTDLLRITITPDAGPQAPLGQRTLPGYYYEANRPELAAHWGLRMARWPAPGTAIDPLDVDFSDAAFFRIEGHVGHAVKDVKDALCPKKRRERGLPFQIAFLTLGTYDQTGLANYCPPDLQANYEVQCAQLRATLEREKNFFSKLEAPATSGKVIVAMVVDGDPVADGDGLLRVRGLYGSEELPIVLSNGVATVDFPEGEYVVQAVVGGRESEAIVVDVTDGEVTKKFALSDTHKAAPTTRGFVSGGFREVDPMAVSSTRSDALMARSVLLNSKQTAQEALVNRLGAGYDVATAPDRWLAERRDEKPKAGSVTDISERLSLILALLDQASVLLPAKLVKLDVAALQTNQDALRKAAEDLENVPQGSERKNLPTTLLQHLKRLQSLGPVESFTTLLMQRKLRLNEYVATRAFKTFFDEHPSLEHLGGVPRGGTFVLAEEGGLVTADFALAYPLFGLDEPDPDGTD